MVYNIEEEPLPGVSVRVEQTETFSVSNGNGLFGKRPNILSVPPGTWDLVYFKTGFTSARQVLTTGEGRLLQAPPVHLWPLPSAKGVYVLEGLTYASFTRVAPERHVAANNRPVFGVKLTPDLVLDAPPAQIITHKMANYDWQLSRLEEVTVLRPGVEAPPPDADPETVASRTERVWAAAVRLPIQASPVDEPDQQLWHITPSVELGPGSYAVHWGALDGDLTTEPLAYLIRIRDPNAPPEEEAPPAAAATGESPEEDAPEEEAPEEEAPEDEAPAEESAATELQRSQ